MGGVDAGRRLDAVDHRLVDLDGEPAQVDLHQGELGAVAVLED